MPAPAQQAIDTHGDSGVGWLKGGRLLVLDFEDHISTMNADGSDRNVVFQTDLPILGMSVCPDGERALFIMPSQTDQSDQRLSAGRYRRTNNVADQWQVRPEPGVLAR